MYQSFYIILALATFSYVNSATSKKDGNTCEANKIERGATVGEKLRLQCPTGTNMRILDAVFGNDINGTYCKKSSNLKQCISQETLTTVRKSCSQKQICDIPVNENYLGIPVCSKGSCLSLKVTYECVKACFTRRVGCEDDVLHLSCPNDCKIWILNVMYGREIRSPLCLKVLPKYKKFCNKNDCFKTCNSSTSALALVETRCNNKSGCNIDILNQVYGPICAGVYKYMTVDYQCLPQAWFNRYESVSC